MKIRSRFEVIEPSEGLVCDTPSRTQQHFKEECDVNNILRNYVSTGVLSHVSASPPNFGDYTETPQDYAEALALIARAKADFDSLPAEVRKRFDNDPQALLNFLQDDKNREEAISLGLVNKSPVEDPEASGTDLVD